MVRASWKIEGESLIPPGPPPNDDIQEFGGRFPLRPHQANNNPNPDNHNNTRPPKKKKTRANIMLATLNIKGQTSTELGNSPISKWSAIHQVMRENKIGILCAQEMHLLPEHERQIETLYSRRLKVFNSRDPHHPSNSAIAIILNKELTNIDDIEIKEIIPGRALAIKTKWHNNSSLVILNVYAPNDPMQHSRFWEKITNVAGKQPTKPQLCNGGLQYNRRGN